MILLSLLGSFSNYAKIKLNSLKYVLGQSHVHKFELLLIVSIAKWNFITA